MVISREVINQIRAADARSFKVVPVGFGETGLIVAIGDPLDIDTIDGLNFLLQREIELVQSAIVSRLKIMTGSMSIAEKRLPQDGRIQVKIGRKPIDLRVSTIPTNHGESVVMRLLDKSSLVLGLPELGFLSDDQEVFERLLQLPDGILLVTGPTGSGKTSTLYACLNYINKPDRKIITIEEPVEYQMNGINQVQVNADIGMTFPAALRSILRQAPNIIMIGEIRDLETASIATNASLTGHLVFSTLHTNDAMSAALESYKADNGVYPRDPTNNTTDNLDARNPTAAAYAPASLYLYRQLSGNTANRQPRQTLSRISRSSRTCSIRGINP
jgi:energy-coupling factor transporter ATP-binding protein EcfA2